jgi:hypothetical protein
VFPQAGVVAASADVPAVAKRVDAPKPKASRPRTKNSAPKRTKSKTTTSHGAPPPFPSPSTSPSPKDNAKDPQDVLDDGSTRYKLQVFLGFHFEHKLTLHTVRNDNISYMEMLDKVNITPLALFDVGMGGDEEDDADEGEEGEEDEGDEGVVEVKADGKKKKRRANNYTEIEDAMLCRAWAVVGMDAVSGTDQTGKSY